MPKEKGYMLTAYQMHELDLPKQKATDLLKQHGGDVVQTMIAYIKPTV